MTPKKELLIEIGCEEIPADWLDSLAGAFSGALDGQLKELRLASSPVLGYATPRRLVATARVAEAQEDRVEILSGPPARIARDESGWTRAATGFAKKHGVAPEDLDRLLGIRSGPRGDHVVLERPVPGRPALDLLSGALREALFALRFPKTMQWDATLDGRAFPFGRPIRWVVALFGGEEIPFRIEVLGGSPVVAGRSSRGHRFRSPDGDFEVSSFEELKNGLRERFVLLDPAERLARLEREIEAAEAARGAKRVEAISLSRLSGLVEWPGVVTGEYPDEFLELPEAIRRTVLVEHQKYLPLAGTPSFLAITGMPDDPEGRIRKGSERVTLARLRDARFFWREDRKLSLEERRSRLEQVSFHARLGNFLEKSDRLAALAGRLAEQAGMDPQVAGQAARLAKSDLTTLLVGEFASLQGVVGGLLLREEGAPEGVWKAVRDHYLPGGFEGRMPETAPGALVSLADNADGLVGLTLAGEAVSGAGDPFGLRRAAFSLIRILNDAPGTYGGEWPTPSTVLDLAFAGYPGPAFDHETARAALEAFLVERLRRAFEREFPGDAVRAALGSAPGKLRVDDLGQRISAMARVRETPDFARLAAAANRVRRILPAEVREEAGPPDPALFTETAEKELAARVEAARAAVAGRFEAGEYLEGLQRLASIRAAVDRFFDEVLVMAEDEATRRNRLRLLAGLDSLFSAVGDLGALEKDRT